MGAPDGASVAPGAVGGTPEFAGSPEFAGTADTAGTPSTGGRPATAGTAGIAGTAGRPGTAGIAGTAGGPATAGIADTAGRAGTKGTLGTAGRPGTAGTVGPVGRAGRPATVAADVPAAATAPGAAPARSASRTSAPSPGRAGQGDPSTTSPWWARVPATVGPVSGGPAPPRGPAHLQFHLGGAAGGRRARGAHPGAVGQFLDLDAQAAHVGGHPPGARPIRQGESPCARHDPVHGGGTPGGGPAHPHRRRAQIVDVGVGDRRVEIGRGHAPVVPPLLATPRPRQVRAVQRLPGPADGGGIQASAGVAEVDGGGQLAFDHPAIMAAGVPP